MSYMNISTPILASNRIPLSKFHNGRKSRSLLIVKLSSKRMRHHFNKETKVIDSIIEGNIVDTFEIEELVCIWTIQSRTKRYIIIYKLQPVELKPGVLEPDRIVEIYQPNKAQSLKVLG